VLLSGLAVAVVGTGRAGMARIRLLEDHPRARLAAIVSRNPAFVHPSAERKSLERVLEDPTIAAVILCTPNRLHAAAARSVLQADKHLLVEFPLAESGREARAILDLARMRGKQAHVEHIELISPSQQRLREKVAGLGRPCGGSLCFQSDSTGWIGDATRAGSPALRAVARIHRLIDLFGQAQAHDVCLERSAQGYRLEVEFFFVEGGTTRLVEERRPGLARIRNWKVQCEHGELDNPPSESAPGLFRDDFDSFLARIEHGSESYVSEDRIVHVLDLVERIDGACGWGPD